MYVYANELKYGDIVTFFSEESKSPQLFEITTVIPKDTTVAILAFRDGEYYMEQSVPATTQINIIDNRIEGLDRLDEFHDWDKSELN